MAIVSVTRLQVRSLRFLPPFVFYSLLSTRQVRRAAGFRAGWLGNESARAFWTATTWDSLDAMRAYRNSAPHRNAMKKLLHWCDEASYVHWEQERVEPPGPETAFQRLGGEGKVSKVLHPSERQRAGRPAGALRPKPGRAFRPK
jgi:hypothetical protein